MTQQLAGYPVRPGDVLLTRHGNLRTRAGRAGWLIRLGAWLAGEPHTVDHVIVAHHIDDAGTYWGVQGQPGTVAYVDIKPWLDHPATIHNAAQPKTDEQRDAVCAVMDAMVTGRVMYDWTAIVADALQVVAPLWRMKDNWGGEVPTHVVCSSAADFAYEHIGLANPHADRWCTPGHWERFIRRQEWTLAA